MEENFMNMKPSNKQCELARAITRSKATDQCITRELNCTSQKEWNEMCKVLDELLQKHNRPFDDEGWNITVEDSLPNSSKDNSCSSSVDTPISSGIL